MRSCLKSRFTTIATNQEAADRSTEVPKLLRSPCHFCKWMGMYRCELRYPSSYSFQWSLCIWHWESGAFLLVLWNMLVGFSGIFVGDTSSGPWVTELTNVAQLNIGTVTGSAAQFTGFSVPFYSLRRCLLSQYFLMVGFF